MNWFAFFGVLFVLPVFVAAIVGLFHVAAFVAEACPWWVPAGLILLIIATFFGLVIEP